MFTSHTLLSECDCPTGSSFDLAEAACIVDHRTPQCPDQMVYQITLPSGGGNMIIIVRYFLSQ